MLDDPDEHQVRWKSCNREEICAEKMTPDFYRPITTDPEYIDNWVVKLDLLCKSQSQIGFIGSCYFIGIIIAIAWVPRYSDIYGRVPFILGTVLLQIVAQLYLFYTESLTQAYFFIMLLGITLPGKNIVFLNYVLEVQPLRFKQFSVNCLLLSETFFVIFTAFVYQNINNNWKPLQIFGLVISIISFVEIFHNFDESPKFLYNQGRFEEAR